MLIPTEKLREIVDEPVASEVYSLDYHDGWRDATEHFKTCINKTEEETITENEMARINKLIEKEQLARIAYNVKQIIKGNTPHIYDEKVTLDTIRLVDVPDGGIFIRYDSIFRTTNAWMKRRTYEESEPDVSEVCLLSHPHDYCTMLNMIQVAYTGIILPKGVI